METFEREYRIRCPRTSKETVHQVRYQKEGKTERMLDFHCGLQKDCRDCERNYED